MKQFIEKGALIERLMRSPLLNSIQPTWASAAGIIDIISNFQTVDLVPKEAVKALEIANEKMYSAIEGIKTELAKEIFEQIVDNSDMLFDGYRNILVITEKDFTKLEKKYTEGETE